MDVSNQALVSIAHSIAHLEQENFQGLFYTQQLCTILYTKAIEYQWQTTYLINFSTGAYCGISLWKK